MNGKLYGERLTTPGALLCILNWLDATNLEAQRTAAVGVTAVLISTVGFPLFYLFDKFELWAKKNFTGAASIGLQALAVAPLYAATYYGSRAIRRYMVDEDIMRPPKLGPFLPVFLFDEVIAGGFGDWEKQAGAKSHGS